MARAVSQEMHAGFADLRRDLPFDACRAPGRVSMSQAAETDIKRVRQIWREARRRFGTDGEWLFGQFGIAGAMYAPVRSEEHTSELQSLMRISYAGFCLQKKTTQ